MTDLRKETSPPRPKFHIVVDIDGVGAQMHFQEVSGLDAEWQRAGYPAGRSESISSKMQRGIAKTGRVTLKRGIAANDRFAEWYALLQKNSAQRATVRITLLDESGSSAAMWTLTNAFPTKIVGPDLNAQANEVVIETLELEHEGLIVSNDDGDARQ